jgi:hypothetical protein
MKNLKDILSPSSCRAILPILRVLRECDECRKIPEDGILFLDINRAGLSVYALDNAPHIACEACKHKMLSPTSMSDILEFEDFIIANSIIEE